ncbi:unnamed protein product [Rhizophagus irregularis]|nr:unnamed protein product [Rhizophagus irregularis]
MEWEQQNMKYGNDIIDMNGNLREINGRLNNGNNASSSSGSQMEWEQQSRRYTHAAPSRMHKQWRHPLALFLQEWTERVLSERRFGLLRMQEVQKPEGIVSFGMNIRDMGRNGLFFQNCSFSGFLRMQDRREERSLLLNGIEEPSPRLEFVKGNWHSGFFLTIALHFFISLCNSAPSISALNYLPSVKHPLPFPLTNSF